MYIAPNSVIHILNGVRLDNTYTHTIFFGYAEAQRSFFSSKAKYTRTQYTYLRKERAIRVDIPADNLYDCNYIMFQNTAFGTKWFYAFIINVEYVNNVTSNIYYEIDVMQTWFFDVSVLRCFIEREHPNTDDVGDNLVPDNLEIGEYISDDFDGTGLLGNYAIVVAATFDENLDDAVGGEYSNIYSGLCFNVFQEPESVNNFITKATNKNKSSGIVSVFMMPNSMVAEPNSPPAYHSIEKTKKIDGAIDGYVPHNNKLYTYPYNFLYVTNLNGVGVPFPYEYFSDADNCEFSLVGDMSCNPQVVLVPNNYKGVPTNYNEKMVLDGFPQCSYNTDSFKAWLAQNSAGQMVSVGTAAASVIAGVATGGIGLAVTGAISIANTLAQVVQHATLPQQAQNAQGNSAMVAMRIKDFAFMHMHIRSEFAKIVDNYWDMYGYPCHEVKTPNRNQRPHWNYVKTINANIVGNIPADDLAKMKSIYDAGVTFWKNGDEIGNYGLDNRVGGE